MWEEGVRRAMGRVGEGGAKRTFYGAPILLFKQKTRDLRACAGSDTKGPHAAGLANITVGDHRGHRRRTLPPPHHLTTPSPTTQNFPWSNRDCFAHTLFPSCPKPPPPCVSPHSSGERDLCFGRSYLGRFSISLFGYFRRVWLVKNSLGLFNSKKWKR
jgi:hypothetical protein